MARRQRVATFASLPGAALIRRGQACPGSSTRSPNHRARILARSRSSGSCPLARTFDVEVTARNMAGNTTTKTITDLVWANPVTSAVLRV